MRDDAIHQLLSGERRGIGPATLRALLRAAEPAYSGIVMIRNILFSSRILPSRALPVPVISVGNITAGGTGKTPVVRWLASRLRDLNFQPAILLRGYRRSASGLSDEQALLDHFLNDGSSSRTIVHADPDRVAGGRYVLEHHPDVDVFILDDGFQHRRLRRDFDLVLVDALNPFGYGHVHPRGLLREPLRGLRRADAFILTRSDQVTNDQRDRIESTLRSRNPAAPLYRARHAHTGFRSPAAAAGSHAPDLSLDALRGRRFFAFAGIANSVALERQLAALPGAHRGHHWFPDHHDYTDADLVDLRRQAAAASADVLLTTEKDWTKLARFPAAREAGMPIWRIDLQIRFDGQGESGLLDLIQARIESAATAAKLASLSASDTGSRSS